MMGPPSPAREIRESDPDIFLQLLRFFYCDEVTYQDENDAIQMWYLADRYDVPSLVTKCLDFLDGAMKPLNAFDIIPHARKLNAEKLEESCWEVIDYNAKISSMTIRFPSSVMNYCSSLSKDLRCASTNYHCSKQ